MVPRQLLIAMLVAGDAVADEGPVATSEQPTKRAEPGSRAAPRTEPAIDWASAPPADQASGVESEQRPTSTVRRIGRAILFVPRWLVWGIAQPFRGTAYAYDHYNLPGVYDRTFYNRDHSFGVLPTASYESGYGFTGGVRVVHNDLFGDGERARLRADFGGRYFYGYGVNVTSGRRLGDRVMLDFAFDHQRRPNEQFFGIGNLDEPGQLPAMPIAPTTAAFETRFREDMVRGVAQADVRLVGPLHLRASGAASSRIVQSSGDDDSVERVYMTDPLVGWNSGVQHLRAEGELVYDTRRPTNPYMSRAIDATGWLVIAHAGTTHGVAGDPSSFQTYGGEVQRFFDLYRGSRVLALRGLVETVAGGPVSFLDLPRLGGTEFLRGYPSSRFRDRALALGTAEYTWDLGNFMAAYSFIDVGRVAPSLGTLGADWRLGFGGGIQLHTRHQYIGRAQLAANRDGDVFVELVFSPAFPRRERVGRL